MTEVEALCHAGIYKHTPPEIMDEIVRFMPGYLWIVDDYYGDVGLPEFDMPTHGRRARLIHCGVCGQEQVEESRRGGRYAVKYAQNDGIMCPFCCEFVTVKHVSRGIKGVTDRLDAVYYQKSAVNPRALVAFAARCERRFADADAREPWALEPDVSVRGIAVFDAEAHDSIRLQTRPIWEYDAIGAHHVGYMWREVKNMNDLHFGDGALFAWQRPDRAALEESFARAIRGTPFERAWHEDYWCGRDGVKALHMIARYPCVEYLTKLGLTDFLAEVLNSELPSHVINWRGASMSKVLGLSKARLGELKGKKIRITPLLCAVLQVVDRDHIRCSAEVADGVAIACRGERTDIKYKLRSALNAFPVERRAKALKFIARNSVRRFHDIVDLWRMVTDTGGSLAVGDEAFPKDFQAAHDRLIGRIKLQESETLTAAIAKQMPKLTKKYGFEFGGLILRPAASAAEIVREGETLHHCVAGYVDRYAAGSTVICVLRRAVEPDAPWRTVEISAKSGKVIQDRGLHNDWGAYKIDDQYRAALDLFWEAWSERKKRNDEKVRASA